MYKYIIDSAGNGLNGLGLFALLTMVAIFLIGVFVAFVRSRGFHDHMAALPLDFNEETEGTDENRPAA